MMKRITKISRICKLFYPHMKVISVLLPLDSNRFKITSNRCLLDARCELMYQNLIHIIGSYWIWLHEDRVNSSPPKNGSTQNVCILRFINSTLRLCSVVQLWENAICSFSFLPKNKNLDTVSNTFWKRFASIYHKFATYERRILYPSQTSQILSNDPKWCFVSTAYYVYK